ncbi:MAG: copper homeostasis protein CutC [Bacteroidales bacterium]|nr:copper homeostasis protein CutC [Bacteroidales bacterium]
MRYVFEGCCTSAADAVTAQHSGAVRIELCSRLDIGGVTPSESLLRDTLLALAEDFLISSQFTSTTPASDSVCADIVSSSPILSDAVPDALPTGGSGDCVKVNVLVRPRGGDFVYSEEEIQKMLEGIEMCKRLAVRDSAGREHRVNGVVIGALLPDGSIDMATMRRLIAAARPLEVTFHRAFDECADVERCLEDVIALGCERLLTSGHAADAYAGRFALARLVRQAAGRIIILAGCGVRPHNIDAIASAVLSGSISSPSLSSLSLSSPSFSSPSDRSSSTGSSFSPLEFHASTLTGW